MGQYASIYWKRNKPFAHNFLKIQLYLSRFFREAEQKEYAYINMYLYKHMEISKEMYYKELAHALQSLRSPETSVGKLEAQKAGRVHGAVLVPVQSAATRRAVGVKLQAES